MLYNTNPQKSTITNGRIEGKELEKEILKYCMEKLGIPPEQRDVFYKFRERCEEEGKDWFKELGKNYQAPKDYDWQKGYITIFVKKDKQKNGIPLNITHIVEQLMYCINGNIYMYLSGDISKPLTWELRVRFESREEEKKIKDRLEAYNAMVGNKYDSIFDLSINYDKIY